MKLGMMYHWPQIIQMTLNNWLRTLFLLLLNNAKYIFTADVHLGVIMCVNAPPFLRPAFSPRPALTQPRGGVCWPFSFCHSNWIISACKMYCITGIAKTRTFHIFSFGPVSGLRHATGQHYSDEKNLWYEMSFEDQGLKPFNSEDIRAIVMKFREWIFLISIPLRAQKIYFVTEGWSLDWLLGVMRLFCVKGQKSENKYLLYWFLRCTVVNPYFSIKKNSGHLRCGWGAGGGDKGIQLP